MTEFVIALPGPSDRPPFVAPRPLSGRGLLWAYLPATPDNARRALSAHDQHWADWTVDSALLSLAGEQAD
jgi:hypothetical protein